MKRMNRKSLKLAMTVSTIGLATTLALTSIVQADESFPEREIRVIIPYSPGGATDIIFRLAGQEAEKQLSEPIIAVNMAGAGATLGSRHVMNANPDGYTILGSHDTIATSYLSGAVDYSYDAFEPIALLTQTINMAGTYSEHPVTSADEIAQYVADNPGEVTFSMTPSSTDHFFWAQFFNTVGISMEDVRLVGYPGTSDQVEALLAKEIDFAMLDMPTAVSFFNSGDLKSLGVAHNERLNNLPDAPTLQELGIDMVHYTNRGLFAPKGTSEEILSTLENAFETAMTDEALQSRIESELGSIVNFIPRKDYIEYLNKSQEDLSAAAETIGFSR